MIQQLLTEAQFEMPKNNSVKDDIDISDVLVLNQINRVYTKSLEEQI
jgi:hypothetical protein